MPPASTSSPPEPPSSPASAKRVACVPAGSSPITSTALPGGAFRAIRRCSRRTDSRSAISRRAMSWKRSAARTRRRTRKAAISSAWWPSSAWPRNGEAIDVDVIEGIDDEIGRAEVLTDLRARIAHRDAGHSRAFRGENADVRVLEDETRFRRDAELLRRHEITLGIRLAVRDFTAVDDEREGVADAEATEDLFDGIADGGGSDGEQHFARVQLAHDLDRARHRLEIRACARSVEELLPHREQRFFRFGPMEVRAHLANVVDDAHARALAKALRHLRKVGALRAAEGVVRVGMLRFEIDDGLVEVEDHRRRCASRANVAACWICSLSAH